MLVRGVSRLVRGAAVALLLAFGADIGFHGVCAPVVALDLQAQTRPQLSQPASPDSAAHPHRHAHDCFCRAHSTGVVSPVTLPGPNAVSWLPDEIREGRPKDRPRTLDHPPQLTLWP